MRVLCFSSFTFSYLNRARVLFTTLRRFQPTWRLVALISDAPPPGVTFDCSMEPFDEVVYAGTLPIPNFNSWIFCHDIVEACTAVKGPYLLNALSGDVDAVVYLDPDIALFAPLDSTLAELKDHDILLTPHLLEPETQGTAVLDNEVCALRTGIFNLGFVAVKRSAEGLRFAAWWNERLQHFCYDDPASGLFVDQKWCDYVPVFFNTAKTIRDPGCNVASWNLSQRNVSITDDGQILVNGSPLKFWHFTKLGSVADTMTRRYAKQNYEVYEIWNWYRREIALLTNPLIPQTYWVYGEYEDRVPVEKTHRTLYRSRPELQSAYPNPFAADPASFRQAMFP